MDEKDRVELHKALREAFGQHLDRRSIARAEQEFESIRSLMEGCGDITGLASKWLFVLLALNTIVLVVTKKPLFESKYLLLMMAITALALMTYGISAFNASRYKVARQREAISFVIEELKELRMGDTNINTGQAGVVGSNGHAHDMTFSQGTTDVAANIDMAKLAQELSSLLPQLASTASTSEQYSAVSEVAKARDAAANGDRGAVVVALGKAGKWVLEVAEKIGVKVVADAITASLSIK